MLAHPQPLNPVAFRTDARVYHSLSAGPCLSRGTLREHATLFDVETYAVARAGWPPFLHCREPAVTSRRKRYAVTATAHRVTPASPQVRGIPAPYVWPG